VTCRRDQAVPIKDCQHPTTKIKGKRTLNGLSVEYPKPTGNSFLEVGFTRPRDVCSIGSKTRTIVLDFEDLTVDTSTRPRQYPTLKKEVFTEIRDVRLRPATGSMGSSVSSRKVNTWPSADDR
jgi:hypothetical protein